VPRTGPFYFRVTESPVNVTSVPEFLLAGCFAELSQYGMTRAPDRFSWTHRAPIFEHSSHSLAFGCLTVLIVVGHLRSRWSANSASARWTNETEIDPSPTAEATRLTLPQRTSPTANTPGSEVSSSWGQRSSGHRAAARSSLVRSHPVLMKPFASSATRPFSQAVFASAPVIRNTCLRS
jgi:hypothetical protein